MESADQQAWVEIAQAIRSQLLRYAAIMPAMAPDDLKTFTEAAQTAYWLEHNAATFDHQVEMEQARTAWSE